MKNNTLFVDIDGTIIKYREFKNLGKVAPEPIQDVIDYINDKYERGAVVVITTARPKDLELLTKQELEQVGVSYHQIVFDCGRGTRILLNDKDPEYPLSDRAVSINFERDKGFENGKNILSGDLV